MQSGRSTLKLRIFHNIRAHLRWLHYLAGNEFFKEVKRKYQSRSILQRLQAIVRQVVETEIYAKNTTPGTGAIKESVTAIVEESPDANATVYFDPLVSTSKGPFESGDPEKASYAAFFDNPSFNSFILGKGIDTFNPIKYRPFKEPMVQAFNKEAEEQAVRMLMAAVKMHRPRPVKAE